MAKLTPMKAIRKKCLECSCGQIKEVRLCPVKNCALYEYRLGHRPTSEEDIAKNDSNEKLSATRGVLKERGRSMDVIKAIENYSYYHRITGKSREEWTTWRVQAVKECQLSEEILKKGVRG